MARPPIVLQNAICASPGIAVGRAFVVDRRRLRTPRRHIAADEVPREIARFRQALDTSLEQVGRMIRKLAERASDDHYQILEAHQLILRDEHLIEPTLRKIEEEQVNAEWALRKTVEEIKTVFDQIDSDYFRERRSDIDFVGDRILRNLLGVDTSPVQPPPGSIIVAHDLSPADTIALQRSGALAFVTDVGGKTSHSAILARAFDIPSLIVDHATEVIGTGDLLIVDGILGRIVTQPAPELIEQYRQRAQLREDFQRELERDRSEPAETKDGHRIQLKANVDIVDEVGVALERGSEGIGLYRTEFLYLERSEPPREEEHLMHARGILRRVHPYPVTFRTLDLGGDKIARFGGVPQEENPALGLRSLRLCLREKELFSAQLRGLLRASVHGHMRIMFPMVSGVGELRAAKAALKSAMDELDRDGLAYDRAVRVGVMIEMPSAVMIADLLAKECDFLSIGTNDLIQYSLAIDRVNEHVNYLYQPLHPAILRMVRYVVDAGHAHRKPVAVCGEMASVPSQALVLLGLGVDELSVSPAATGAVRRVVRDTSYAAARALADELLDYDTPERIERRVRQFMEAQYARELLDSPNEPGEPGVGP